MGGFAQRLMVSYFRNAELLFSCKRASGEEHIDPDYAPIVIIEKLWKRLRESHRLRVVK